MAVSEPIPRVRIDPFGLDFDTLKKDGLALAQGLSGGTWTDYNPHDPGVTILEQLCYGLTELAYRSGFEVKDYLASKNGSIDFDRLALYKPEAIFSSQAVTCTDFCKLLFAAIPDLDDIRFLPVKTAGQKPFGLYRVMLKLYEPLDQSKTPPQQGDSMEDRVRAIFSANRSLCEDIESIAVIKTKPCFLRGEIEIQGHRPPAEIYAEIFFKCARKVSSNIRIERYEDMAALGMSREELFTGPLTAQGYIRESDFEDTRAIPTMAELVSLVSRVEGVKQVHSLELVCEVETDTGIQFSGFTMEASDVEGEVVPSLRFPDLSDPQHLHLLKLSHKPFGNVATAPLSAVRKSESDIKERLLLEAAKLQLKKLEFEYRAFRNNEQALAQFISLPRGKYRQFRTYYSIQDQFPHIYGINRAGVPSSAAPDIKARAKQLKAYLFPFEQLMANYLQTLHELPRLFSIDPDLRQSYFSQYLSDENLPEIESLYALRGMPAVISHLQSRYDDYAERRSRVLDVMLAMYGEGFAQDALLRFNYYRKADAGQWAIENKLNLLKNLTELSCRRAGAMNMQAEDRTSQIGSWHKRVAILLGIKHFSERRSLCAVFTERNIELLSDAAYDQLAKSRSLPANDPHAKPVPTLMEGLPDHQGAIRLKDCKVSESMLQQGYEVSRYRLVEAETETVLYFQGAPENPLYRMASQATKNDAIVSALKFSQAIIDLNQEAEGLHVIEHILLRPGPFTAEAAEDFYAFRLSVVLPAWTARFADPEFRKYAEETVCHQLPSHLYPIFYWLDFATMFEFERLHHAWLNAHTEQYKHQSAQALVRFLQEKRSDDALNYWV